MLMWQSPFHTMLHNLSTSLDQAIFFEKPGIAEAGLILKEHFLSLLEVVGLVTAEWHCLPVGKVKVGRVWPTFGLNGTGCTQEETNVLPVCNNGGEAICGALEIKSHFK